MVNVTGLVLDTALVLLAMMDMFEDLSMVNRFVLLLLSGVNLQDLLLRQKVMLVVLFYMVRDAKLVFMILTFVDVTKM